MLVLSNIHILLKTPVSKTAVEMINGCYAPPGSERSKQDSNGQKIVSTIDDSALINKVHFL